jgi:XTP/dITP diphosphohydrolase
MLSLLIATRNLHKVDEIQAILGAGFRYLTLNDFPGGPEVVEDAGTFAGNATKKAVTLAKWLGRTTGFVPDSGANLAAAQGGQVFVLADDSGLEVDALEGAPGIHSARFAALDSGKSGNSPTAENNAKLLRLLGDLPIERRSARFRCVLALTPVSPSTSEGASPACYADQTELQTQLFEGACEGHIGFAPRGRGGFGYDPLFIPSGYAQTFGELSEDVKNELSHRAHALAKLKRWLRGEAANVSGV